VSRPDLAAVLAAHQRFGHGCRCDWISDDLRKTPADDHHAHLAAVLNAAVDAWLADEKTRETVVRYLHEERGGCCVEGWPCPKWADETREEAAAPLAALTQREDTP
jgi:hypothetical protein